MSTSTLQLLPTAANDLSQLDPAALANIPGVAYDLKRLKVYSSCLRCRAKKVKCDRKEPCSRCEKHNVECSYRELASVQLDIRQFQRHLNNPKIRKDGAGIITSTATPIITLPSGSTAVLSPTSPATASLIAAAKAAAVTSTPISAKSPIDTPKAKKHSPKSSISISTAFSAHAQVHPASAAPSPRRNIASASSSANSTDTESDSPSPASSKSIAMARAKVHKIHRRKVPAPAPPKAAIQVEPQESASEFEFEEDEEIERVVLRDDDFSTSYHHDVNMSSEGEGEDESRVNIPIWRAQAVGKHKQTVHEQDLAETFGLAAYLKAKEESHNDSGMAGQMIDYDMELEKALAQRMPTSFTRPDRSFSRARKYAQAGYNPSLPYARPAHCQLSSPLSSVNTTTASYAAPPAAQCCCQIAAKQGQAPGTCFYSNTSHSGYEKSSSMSVSPPPESPVETRIQYSPSYSAKDATATTAEKQQEKYPQTSNDWPASSMSMMPPHLPLVKMNNHNRGAESYSTASSPRTELPPIYLPQIRFSTTPASSDLSKFQVGRHAGGNNAISVEQDGVDVDSRQPLKIECKYNEPNVDAWDMIEKPISRTVPVTTKRGRSVKMEMGWILS